MADKSKIQWTDATWNPVTGCKIVSPGCANCYAMRLAGTRLKNHPSRAGLTTASKAGPVWNGRVRFNDQWLMQPLRWERPRDIFVVAHGDLFYERVPYEWIDKVFAVMALSQQHRFQVLTKRPERMRAYLQNKDHAGNVRDWLNDQGPTLGLTDQKIVAACHAVSSGPLPNTWLGTSVEDIDRADQRREPLSAIAKMGWKTWVSYEPALGLVDWRGWEFIKWMVSGGEDGDRPSHPDWHRATRDWCAINGIPYHFKQWGAFREWSEPPYDQNPSHEVVIGSEEDEACAAAARHPCWVAIDGRRFNTQEAIPDGVPARLMERVGKMRACRLLDGREHNGRPG